MNMIMIINALISVIFHLPPIPSCLTIWKSETGGNKVYNFTFCYLSLAKAQSQLLKYKAEMNSKASNLVELMFFSMLSNRNERQ